MKIFNLNQYSGHDEMGGELRKRMEGYDPGLPESLWDRISHEMDQREVNRKKRMLWWFSSVAVAALMVGVATTLLYKDAGTDTIATNPTYQQQPGVVSESAQPKTQVTESEINTSSATQTITETNIHNVNTPGNKRTGITGTSQTDKNAADGKSDKQQTAGGIGTGEGDALTQGETSTGNSQQGGEAGKNAETNNGGKADAAVDSQTKKAENTHAPNDAEDKQPVAQQGREQNEDKPGEKGKFTRWMFGLNYGYEKSMRTYANAGPSYFNRPTAEEHNRFESPANTSSISLDIRFFPLKHLFIKSGITKYSNAERIQYNIAMRTEVLSAIPPYGDPRDSVVGGNNITAYSTNNWIQIPLEVGYSYNVNPKVGVYASAGAAYSMLQSYTYNEFQSAYLNAFRPWNNNNSDLYRHNHLTANFNAGVMYSFTSHFGINVSFLYRRVADNIIDSKATRLSYRPYSYGANAGIYFKF